MKRIQNCQQKQSLNFGVHQERGSKRKSYHSKIHRSYKTRRQSNHTTNSLQDQQRQRQSIKPKTANIETLRLHIGDLYLLHPTNPRCPSVSSLWCIFDKRQNNRIYAESASRDLLTFHLWLPIPTHYRYARRATRSELRDYIFNLSWFEFSSRLPTPINSRGIKV
ncbi:MAG: hypothetical protein SNI32_08535 [Rikenellaceae bacterium]